MTTRQFNQNMYFSKIKKIINKLLIACLVYLGLCCAFYFTQTYLIFHPSPQLKSNPNKVNLDYQNIRLSVGKEQIHGWWLKNQNSFNEEDFIILYLHGNSSNIGDCVHRVRPLYQLGLSILLIDYRGYGRSSKIFPNEIRVYQDAETALNYLLDELNIHPSQIVLYGHSLGGAIAIELASRHSQLGGVIVESTFTSMKEMVNYVLPINILPLDLILTQKFDSIAKIKKVQSPVLIIHGTKDKNVPFSMAKELYSNSQRDKKLQLIFGANHNNIYLLVPQKYSLIIKQFLETIRSNLDQKK